MVKWTETITRVFFNWSSIGVSDVDRICLFTGVGEVMNKFKGKFEAKDEEVVPIAHGVHIKKKVMPQALQFQMNEKKEEKEKDKVSKVSVGSM